MSRIEYGLTAPQMIDLSELTTRKAERQLFLRLFDYMAKLEPLVPMRPEFTCEIGDWKFRMLNRQDFGTFYFGTWGIIWENVDWKGCCSGGASEYYGANLLQAFGHLGEAVQMFGDVIIPIDVMLMVMVELQGKRLVLKYSKDQKWLPNPVWFSAVPRLPSEARAHGSQASPRWSAGGGFSLSR